MLEHGGNIGAAAVLYGIPAERWLDLSTGINPIGWPVPVLPPETWSRLPQDDDGLIETARRYYGSENLLPVAGSQAAIQMLPRLRGRARIGVLTPTYAEHARAWVAAAHEVVPLAATAIENTLDMLDVLVLANPNNPTGEAFDREMLLKWHARLAARGGWLVVDEAFMDATPECSLASETQRGGLIVLRSLGKFFGLAGARVGFVLAAPALLATLCEQIGPWTVSGPARAVARAALADRIWQEAARPRLRQAAARLADLLARHGLRPVGGTALFQWAPTPQARSLHDALAHQGILTRLFTDPTGLRFGLPGTETEWQRLEAALTAARRAVA
ncbi:MAG: threonine-phosphate decarboxylase [Gammaproteobacteria bacterium]|nr:threonine-phosphate decarboxylase [Gammaproteobacteria bacterium]